MTQQSSARPFRVLGIQQIAIGGPSKDRLKKLWVEMFGLAVTGNYVSERENVDEDITQMGSGPFRVEVDLMQPLDPAKKPAVHEPPLNHVGLWIDDLPQAVEWLTAQGVRFLHFNGSFHSDFHEGIGWYLTRALPDLTQVTIATVTQEQVDRLDPEHLGQADIIICVDTAIPGTH